MESNSNMKQVFVLSVASPQGAREAIVAEKATWCRVMPGVVERFIEIKGRMTDQETAHRWFDGRDIDLRDSERDERFIKDSWKRYWARHPERTYKVPASSLAYVEELEDRSIPLGSEGDPAEKPSDAAHGKIHGAAA